MSQKRKLLFVASQLHKGGAETSVVNLLKSMDHQQFDVDFIILNQVPMAGTISLIPMIPSWVRVLDVFHKKTNRMCGWRTIYRKLFDREGLEEEAIRFVENKCYDLAIHIGEWHLPSFLACVVKAERKAVWFHTDIHRDKEFRDNEYFAFDEEIDAYFFVSQHSLDRSCEAYPFLRKKAYLLHNALDEHTVRDLSQQAIDIPSNEQLPLLVTVANIRGEKGHHRQLEAMRILKERNKDFLWINIGFLSNEEVVDELKQLAGQYGLSNRFLLLGAKDNPYPWMARSDAVACLSDYESWSMVITEAKCLGIPVVATKTSGALEQIVSGETGLLCDFDATAVADAIEKILFDREFHDTVSRRLKECASLPKPVDEIKAWMKKSLVVGKAEQAPLLFVFDDVNYGGGAHLAAFQHIRALNEQGIRVDVYSDTSPDVRVRMLLPDAMFYAYENVHKNILFERKLASILVSRAVSLKDKRIRLKRFVDFRRGHEVETEDRDVYARKIMDQYQAVCVMSEGSRHKKNVSECSAAYKVQWIHTDYCAWRFINAWTMEQCALDEQLWQRFDRIVVLSPRFIEPLEMMYPSLKGKIVVVGNMLDAQRIRRLAEKGLENGSIRVVSDVRVSEKIKGVDVLSVIQRLYQKGRQIEWTFIGGREERLALWQKAKSMKIEECVACLEPPLDWDLLLSRHDVLLLDEADPRRKEREGSAAKAGIPCWLIASEINTMDEIERELERFLGHPGQLANKRDKRWKSTIVPTADVSFVSVFRFEPIKQPDVIIHTLRKLADSGRRFHWSFVGGGEMLEEAIKLVEELNLDAQITFWGAQANPYPLIADADVLVQFSRYEGLPNTIYEALILGKPVLTSDVGAVRDQIVPGVNGWIIANDAQELYEQLLYIMDHPEETMQYAENLKDYGLDHTLIKRQICQVFKHLLPYTE